jgi:hypothetical protein
MEHSGAPAGGLSHIWNSPGHGGRIVPYTEQSGAPGRGDCSTYGTVWPSGKGDCPIYDIRNSPAAGPVRDRSIYETVRPSGEVRAFRREGALSLRNALGLRLGNGLFRWRNAPALGVRRPRLRHSPHPLMAPSAGRAQSFPGSLWAFRRVRLPGRLPGFPRAFPPNFLSPKNRPYF